MARLLANSTSRSLLDDVHFSNIRFEYPELLWFKGFQCIGSSGKA
ncbi:BnaA06g38680D [Brassica napus]|uniref:BnaA06g38680D protein n=1 Tax=Brassica napus TaxID=3708 RepID=A0A078JDH9_BRANA|nr:BnaA06g38680D [Brassica napus]